MEGMNDTTWKDGEALPQSNICKVVLAVEASSGWVEGRVTRSNHLALLSRHALQALLACQQLGLAMLAFSQDWMTEAETPPPQALGPPGLSPQSSTFSPHEDTDATKMPRLWLEDPSWIWTSWSPGCSIASEPEFLWALPLQINAGK